MPAFLDRLDDPVIAGRIHGVLVLSWFMLVPLSFLLGWVMSVAFVSSLSIVALALTHWSAREAATAQRDLAAQLDRIERAVTGRAEH